jgi:anaerobic magnesium-protoporphyrin IX monomethyl ester cyclase
MQTVTLINPPTPNGRKFTRNADCAAESKGNYLWQPYDFLLISGAFAESVEVNFIDAVADRLDEKQVFTQVLSLQPQLIITSAIDALWEQDLEFIKTLRSHFPDTPILVFGDALIEDYNFEQISPLIDGAILNPFSFHIEAAEKWTREEFKLNSKAIGLRQVDSFQKIIKTVLPGRSLKPRHELFMNRKYRWPFSTYKRYTTITTNWGCPYSCKYCTAASLPSLYRLSSEIIEEMKRVKGLGVREIYFSDKSFGFPLKNTQEILRAMVREKFKFSWSTYIHPNQFSESFFDLMKEAGCHTVIIGIETPHLEQLRKMGRVITENKISDLIRYSNKIGLNVCGDFILGLPEDSESEVLSLIRYSLGLKIDYASFNIATPLPGSVIKSNAIKAGRMTTRDHHFDVTGLNRTLDSDKIPAARLLELKNLANRRFYIRPRYWLRRILRLRGREHLLIQFEEMKELMKKTLRSV